jgi:uncharacterized protein
MMKYAALLTLIFVPLACGDEATKVAKVEELLTVMNVAEQQKQMMDQMSKMVIGQIKDELDKQGNVSQAEIAKAQDKQKRMFALIAQKTSWQDMKPIFVKAYVDTFAEAEIDGMLAFYRSPPGKAMIEKQPALSGKIMTNVQSQLADLMPQIEAILKQQ